MKLPFGGLGSFRIAEKLFEDVTTPFSTDPNTLKLRKIADTCLNFL